MANTTLEPTRNCIRQVISVEADVRSITELSDFRWQGTQLIEIDADKDELRELADFRRQRSQLIAVGTELIEA